MPTGQALITSALTLMGKCPAGYTPSSTDLTDALGELNALWESLGMDEGIIWAQIAQRFALTQNYAVYTMGMGGAFNGQRPARIYNARSLVATGGAISTSVLASGGSGYVANDTGVILGANGSLATYLVNTVSSGAVATYTLSAAGTGYVAGYGFGTAAAGAQPGAGTGFGVNITAVTAGGEDRTALKIVSAAESYRHRDLQAGAQVPDQIYPDYAPDVNGLMRVYFWPVPNSTVLTMVEIEAAVAFLTWALATNYVLPIGAEDMLHYALAKRLLLRFGTDVPQDKLSVIVNEGTRAENRFREMNRINRQMPPGAEAVPAPPAAQGKA